MNNQDKKLLIKLFSPNHDNEVSDYNLKWFNTKPEESVRRNYHQDQEWFLVFEHKGANTHIANVHDGIELWRKLNP